MTTLIYVILVLLSMGLISGYKNSYAWSISFGINTFATPCFDLGISSFIEQYEGYEVHVVSLGVVLFTIEFEFYKQ